MNSTSLARIMFGANQEYSASSSMKPSAVPSLSRSSSEATQRGTLSTLLHRAWSALHHKS